MAEIPTTTTASEPLEADKYIDHVREVVKDAFGKPNRMQLVAILSSCAIAAGALAAAESSVENITSLRSEQRVADAVDQ